jgi:hypothetical protein
VAGINPFRPNLPVHPAMFVGRVAEVNRLEGYLRQTKAGNPVNFMITGERGIGKSSLLNYIKARAEGDLAVEGQDVENFLVIGTDVDRNTTALGLVEKINLSLNRSLARSENAKKYLREVWGFIQRLEVAGVRINSEEQPQEVEKALEEFAYSLTDTVKRVCEDGNAFDAKYDGVLLLIDEADNATLPLGAFLKTLSERLARGGCDRLMFGLGGLPSLRDVLVASHPSSVRLFEGLFLQALETDEIVEIIEISLKRAQEDNEAEYNVTDGAIDLLVELSGGIPHFIQQFGYSAFDADKDRSIDEADVLSGATDEYGAIDQVGNRYFEDPFNALDLQGRTVLGVVAAANGDWVAPTQISRSVGGEQAAVDTAIQRLVERQDLELGYPDGTLHYRLRNRAFSMWVAQRT